MATGKDKIVSGEYYHVLNRGNNKQNIFIDDRDRVRLLFLILYFQSSTSIYNIGRPVSYFVKHQMFNKSNDLLEKILKNRIIELVNFSLMPNHFHLILYSNKENGISSYMQRIQNSYTKYFNTRHNKSGHLFQGVFKRIHIKNNEQLLHLSAYIHRNPRELSQWKNKENKYPWSSYQDCVGENRWGELLKPKIITGQFSSPKEYQNFVENSGTKLNLEKEHLV